MPLLWGKTRCKEAAGWDDRIASKLMVAGERRQSRQGRAASCRPAAAACPGLYMLQSTWRSIVHALQVAWAPRLAACCRWCSSSRWCASPPSPQPRSSCSPAASQVCGCGCGCDGSSMCACCVHWLLSHVVSHCFTTRTRWQLGVVAHACSLVFHARSVASLPQWCKRPPGCCAAGTALSTVCWVGRRLERCCSSRMVSLVGCY